MHSPLLRSARPSDAAALVRINAAAEHVTSPLDADHWTALEALAALTLVAEGPSGPLGFVLVLDDAAPYDSANYRWFGARLRRFCYVDRIVVGEAARGAGIGRALYAEVVRWARARELAWVAAEIVCEPPNAPSLAFHAQAGFLELGRRRVDPGKVLSMQALPLADAEASPRAAPARPERADVGAGAGAEPLPRSPQRSRRALE